MLRFLYILCEVLAAVSAIISPVAIVHWLLRIINVPSVTEHITALTSFFEPVNAAVEFVIKTPPLVYNGHSYSTAQGVVGCLFTAMFFLLNFAAESLKAAEQRADIVKHSGEQRRRLQKICEEEQTSQQQVAENCIIYVQVDYDSQACLTGAGYLESAFSKNGGKMLHGYNDALSLAFDSVGQALKYCMDASQQLLSYYATLRPIDPQPPFRIALHALNADLPADEGVAAVRALVNYSGPNQVLFSQDIKTLLELNGLSMLYGYQSVGLYSVGGRRSIELFRLFFTKTSSSL